MNKGDLFGIVSCSTLSESDAKFVIFQVSQGLKYLHDNKIGHGDIKLENILVKNRFGKIIYKIADFGLSVLDRNATKRDGTLQYSAPEVFQEGNPIMSVRKTDIWSLGVVAYMCVSGQFPFDRNDAEKTMMLVFFFSQISSKNVFPLQCFSRQIQAGKISFKELTEISSDMKHLICRMIVVNPKKRFNIYKVLNHTWFNDTELNDRMDDIAEFLQRDVKNSRRSTLRMFSRNNRILY